MTTLAQSLLETAPAHLSLRDTAAPNEVLAACDPADLPAVGAFIVASGGTLATVAGIDLRPQGEFAVEYVFSLPASGEFLRVRATIPAERSAYPSVTTTVPAAVWHERELKDLLGLTPVGHPDPRRLVLHERYPHGYHPLRKDVSATEQPPFEHRRFDYFEVQGEGVYELPVGPIHAGVIEPGHFRFSNIGELILHLDARLFFTHRGVEKIAEGKTFEDALFTVERTCGVCTVSHAVSFAAATERLTGAVVPPRARWLRTLLLELERLYNHTGDIGNICAGTGFHAGTTRGAILKERLQRINETLAGHRFLMGVVGIGGMRYDLSPGALAEARSALADVKRDFEAYVDTLRDSGSFTTRVTGAGILDAATVVALGGTGVAARASGVATDYRLDHPHLAYDTVVPGRSIESDGDVAARLSVRIREALESFALIDRIIAGLPAGPVRVDLPQAVGGSSALGYSESPRGANVHWLMADDHNKVYRLRIRSASFANWPLVARAVVENMVPDFPLINKSFELCYACCDR